MVWCQIWYHFDHVTSMSWHVVYWCHITCQNVMSHLTSHVEKCHVMLCYLMSQNVISHPSHVTLCSFVIWQYIILTHFEDYELRLPTTFKGSFPSDPPSLSLSLSLLPLPPPPTVRVRQREGWRGTGKRESLVRRLLLSFLVCLCG